MLPFGEFTEEFFCEVFHGDDSEGFSSFYAVEFRDEEYLKIGSSHDADGINASWTDNGLAQDDTDSNDIRMAFLFVKSAISYAMWEDVTVRVDELQEQHYDWQLYSRVQYGITRMYAEGGIIGILCDQSPA